MSTSPDKSTRLLVTTYKFEVKRDFLCRPCVPALPQRPSSLTGDLIAILGNGLKLSPQDKATV